MFVHMLSCLLLLEWIEYRPSPLAVSVKDQDGQISEELTQKSVPLCVVTARVEGARHRPVRVRQSVMNDEYPHDHTTLKSGFMRSGRDHFGRFVLASQTVTLPV